MTTLAVNAIAAVSIRILNPAIGTWIVFADLDLPATSPLPTGKVTITIDQEKLIGTVDPTGSGRFAEKAHLRIIAGGGGWHQEVPEQDFHNDGGIRSSDVVQATASAAGELVNEPKPIDLGVVDWLRAKGPARRVLDGRVWYVDELGITHVVDARPERKPSKDVEILSWDPGDRIATLSADTIVWPGTVLEDPRFDSVTIRDVEQTFGGSGARVRAWTASTEGTRLASLLKTMVEEFGGLSWLRVYEYRIIQENVDGRLYLQIVRSSSGVPDALPLSIFPGMAGDTADHTPGTTCLVLFVEGDPKRPVVVAFDGKDPLVRRVYATLKVKLGGPVTFPLAFASPTLAGFAAVSTWVAALQAAFMTYDPVTYGATMATPTSALAAALLALIATLPTVKVEGT